MKVHVQNYTFDKAAKTVTFTDYTTIRLDSVLLVVNETVGPTIIYNFADLGLGGSVATNVLTLAFDTTSMANTDKLLIYYDDNTFDTWHKEDVAFTDADGGTMTLAVRKNTAASTSGSDGDYQPLITNTTGHLWVDASGQTLTVASHAVTNAGTFAVQATQAGTWNIGTLTSVTNVVHVDDNAGSLTVDGTIAFSNTTIAVTNTGTFAAQAAIADGASVTLGAKADAKSAATDTTAISAMSVLKQISASVQAPPSQAVTNAGTFLVQLAANQSVNNAQINGITPLMGNGVTGTGSQRVTIASDNTAFSVNAVQSGTWTVQPGNTANTTAWLTTSGPTTAGGLTMATGSIAATKTVVKASAGQVYGWYIYNANASVAYVQFFNVASAGVTLGTTAPDISIGIPATSAANVEFSNGIAFGTAITIAITTTRAGLTGVGTTVDFNILYK